MTRAGAAVVERVPPTLGRRATAANLLAQGTALVVVSMASLLVARTDGAAVLGEYTLLRVLPWLTGVVVSCGLPVASTYFLGAVRGSDPHLRPTIAVLAVVSGFVSVGVWLVLTPILHHVLFRPMSSHLLALMAITTATQLWTVLAKACCQGEADMLGANLVIVAEELMFLPAYGLVIAVGLRGLTAVAVGMILGGICATATALARLAARGFFRDWGTPSPHLARLIAAFGARGQLGNLLWLVNLRLDFVILGIIAGPATLGIYAVATKFAELMRLPATALNYVLYPRFTRANPAEAATEARWMLRRACAASIAAAPVLAAATIVALPLLFGREFRSAIVPGCILLIGLAVEGASAVSGAYLWGSGRPGVYSAAMGVGVVVTITLDLLLIPRHGAVGAAIASSIAYLTSTGLLTRFAVHRWRRAPAAVDFQPGGSQA